MKQKKSVRIAKANRNTEDTRHILNEMEKERAGIVFVPDLSPSVFMLPAVIEGMKVNKRGRYDYLIDMCRRGYFHDYKFVFLPGTEHYNDPKGELIRLLQLHPPLWGIIEEVKAGIFADQMDEVDKVEFGEVLRKRKIAHLFPKTLGI